MEEWLSSRSLDGTRSHSRLLKRLKGLTSKSDAEVALSVHGACVTDGFWIKDADEDISYEDVSAFKDVLFNAAVYGDLSDTETQGLTPQLTATGSLEKGWKKEGDTWYLYKLENDVQDFNEIFSSCISNLLEIPTAEYQKALKGIKTKNFASEYDFEDAYSLVGDNWVFYPYCYDQILLFFGKDAALGYTKLLYFDAVCRNMDRHSHNFGFLRDRETGHFVSMAPNYDFDQILFGDTGFLTKKGSLSSMSPDLLIRDYVDLVKLKGLNINIPKLSKDNIDLIMPPHIKEHPLYKDAVILVTERQKMLEDLVSARTFSDIY